MGESLLQTSTLCLKTFRSMMGPQPAMMQLPVHKGDFCGHVDLDGDDLQPDKMVASDYRRSRTLDTLDTNDTIDTIDSCETDTSCTQETKNTKNTLTSCKSSMSWKSLSSLRTTMSSISSVSVGTEAIGVGGAMKWTSKQSCADADMALLRKKGQHSRAEWLEAQRR